MFLLHSKDGQFSVLAYVCFFFLIGCCSAQSYLQRPVRRAVGQTRCGFVQLPIRGGGSQDLPLHWRNGMGNCRNCYFLGGFFRSWICWTVFQWNACHSASFSSVAVSIKNPLSLIKRIMDISLSAVYKRVHSGHGLRHVECISHCQ